MRMQPSGRDGGCVASTRCVRGRMCAFRINGCGTHYGLLRLVPKTKTLQGANGYLLNLWMGALLLNSTPFLCFVFVVEVKFLVVNVWF